MRALGWLVVGVVACNPNPPRPTTPDVKPIHVDPLSCPAAPTPLRTVKVDPRSGDDAASGECATSSACTPWKTLAKAGASVKPGDLVLIAAGTYSEDAAFTVSGTSDHPIVFAAADGETPILKKSVLLAGRAFLQFRGLQFDSPASDLWFSGDLDSHDITLVGNAFDSHAPLGASFAGLKLQGKNYTLCGNAFGSWLGDMISAQPIDGFLLENNDFALASGEHSLTAVIGKHIVIRGNVFRNPWHRALHISDRTLDDTTEDVLVENNTFIDSDWTRGNPIPSNQEQFQGGDEVVRFLCTRGIFRNNLLAGNHEGNNWDCRGVLNFETFINPGAGLDSRHFRKLRVYNNTFDSNATSTLMFYQGPTGGDLTDNQFKNNVITNPAKFSIATCSAGVPWSTYRFEDNVVPGAEVRFSEAGDSPESISAMEQSSPDVFAHNLTEAPAYVNGAFASAVAADFTSYSLARRDEAFAAYGLAAGSAGKGQAAALAHVSSAVTAATVLPVDDPLYFSDGYGLVPGDVIRIGPSTARVVSRDVEAKTLTLDAPVTASADAGVSLDGITDIGVHAP